MLRIHECLAGGSFPNCQRIAGEFEVSPKTIQRDVNFMRDQLGLPIEYDKRRFGFHYTRPVGGFPSMADGGGKGRGNPWRKVLPPPGEHRGSGRAAGSDYVARIRFGAESAQAVRGREWHGTQVLSALPDGGVEMTVRVRNEGELVCWVMGWGGHARVVEPARLRAKVREMAREILDRH
jgi:predicted DNA-binding transcriptional regulator YafY